jgi:hypothetical protein
VDQVTVELLDDDYVPDEGEDVGPDLASASTEIGVCHLMGLGMAEMDARHLVAVAKGERVDDSQSVERPESQAHS